MSASAPRHDAVDEAARSDGVGVLAREAAELARALADLRVELRRRDDADEDVRELLASVLEQLAPARAREYLYARTVKRVAASVEELTTRESTCIVLSRGDEALVSFDGRVGWHFPQTAGGHYSGFHLADSTSAIAHLEFLRSRGGDYFVIPDPYLWWLDHYPRFARHLEQRYLRISLEPGAREERGCAIFSLRETPQALSWLRAFDDLIAEFQARHDRDPVVLDWSTGLDLATRYPEHMIFSPVAETAASLPYLDSTVDIVAARAESDLVAEAARVARSAVAVFSGDDAPDLTVRWDEAAPDPALSSVSIVIPSYNGIELTEPCVLSLLENLPAHVDVEILVIDDASTDDTEQRLARIAAGEPRVRVLRNDENMGFLATCNRGAREARHDVVVFLNNDTLAMPNWLAPLLRVFRHQRDAGAATGMFVYPDGRLQEAGCIIFSDGRAANFGKWDERVEDPLYTFVREVDYGSGALLAIPRALLLDLGGFDERYRPIYCEDSDLCFKVRERGLKVYYQPESAVIHLEGATSGTDVSKGDKQYEVLNRAKFVEKWADALRRQPAYPARFDAATRHRLVVREAADR
jgi:GT2 family glycosyltransferase